MTGNNVEDVFAMAAKDAYVKEMKEKQAQEEEEKTDTATPGKGTSSTKGMKLNNNATPKDAEKKKGCC
jgi:hypothetical protein